MKVSIAVGRKGDKLKALYVGNSADDAIKAMKKEVDAEKPKFDEVYVYRQPLYYRRRKISA